MTAVVVFPILRSGKEVGVLLCIVHQPLTFVAQLARHECRADRSDLYILVVVVVSLIIARVCVETVDKIIIGILHVGTPTSICFSFVIIGNCDLYTFIRCFLTLWIFLVIAIRCGTGCYARSGSAQWVRYILAYRRDGVDVSFLCSHDSLRLNILLVF